MASDLRTRMEQALLMPTHTAGKGDPDGPITGALALARRLGACARTAGAEVKLRAVGCDAFGAPFATWALGDHVTTLVLTDTAAVIEGLAELAGRAAA